MGQIRLTNARELDNSSIENLYLWDWEMVQESIYPELTKSVYSGVLWFGLQCLEAASTAEENSRIAIPEGTRLELLRHLNRLAAEARRRDRALSRQAPAVRRLEQMLGTLPESWRSPEWKEVLSDILELARAEQAVTLLLLLMQRFCRPLPYDASVSSDAEFYTRRLESKRPESDKHERNRADAYNLASVKLLDPKRPGASTEAFFETAATPKLVTATAAVSAASGNVTVDPFYFALDMTLRRDFPEKTARRRVLQIMIARVFSMLNTFDPGARNSRTARVRREEVPALLKALSALYDDPVLLELGRLVSTASQAVRNAVSQAQEVSTDLIQPLPSGRFRSLERKICLLLDEIGESRVNTDLGLQWREHDAIQDTRRFSLFESHGRHVLSAEKANGSITLAWETEEPLDYFRSAVDKVAKAATRDGVFVVFVRLPHRPGVLRAEMNDLSGLLARVAQLSEDKKISFLRIDYGALSFWYDPKHMMPDAKEPLARAVISVRGNLDFDIEPLAQFFSDTAAEWCFPQAISHEISRLVAM